MSGDSPVRAWITALDSGNGKVQLAAARGLIDAAGPEVALALQAACTGKRRRARAWAAATLLAKDPRDVAAWEVWKRALGDPLCVADAARAAVLMKDPRAGRELLRTFARLPASELEQSASAEGPSIGHALTKPVPALALETLLESARTDTSALAELVAVVTRGVELDRTLEDALLGFLAELPVASLQKALTALVERTPEPAWAELLTHFTGVSEEAVVRTVEALGPGKQRALISNLAAELRAGSDTGAVCAPLARVLEPLPFAIALRGLTGFGGEDDDDAEDDDDHDFEEDEADDDGGEGGAKILAEVMTRAYQLASVLRRMYLERSSAAAVKQLTTWLDESRLLDHFGEEERAIVTTPYGQLPPELQSAAPALVEELATLLWTLGMAPLPPPEQPTEAASITDVLLFEGPVREVMNRVTAVDVEDLEAELSVWSTLSSRAEAEALRRHFSGPGGRDADVEAEAALQALLEDGATVGEAKGRNRAALVVEAIDSLGPTWVAEAEEAEGRLTVVQGDLSWRGQPVRALTDPLLGEVLDVSMARCDALLWVLTGETPLEEDTDDAPEAPPKPPVSPPRLIRG